ncbi:TetR/AcrR family transcriptional regulator [Gordonia sp. NPDC003422]
MSSGKLWRGQTLADRSTDRRAVLLDAGRALLGEGGAAAVTMRAVIREAKLSPRYFYESFASREELLTAVYDEVSAELFETLTAVAVTGHPRQDVRAFVDAIRDFFERDPRRARILLREPLADDTLRDHRAAATPQFVGAAVAMAGGRIGADRDLAIVSTALSGALVALYLDYSDGRLDVEPDQLVDAAVELIFAIAGEQ